MSKPTRLISFGKMLYAWPPGSNEQDLALFEALSRAAGLKRVYIVAQGQGAHPRAGKSGRTALLFVPRLRTHWLNHLWFAFSAMRLGLRLHRRGETVLQAADPTGGGLAALVVRALTRAPLLVHLQGDLFNLPPAEFSWPRRWLSRRLSAFVADSADQVRCVSEILMREARNAGVRADKLMYVPSRCDTKRFDREIWKEQGEALRRRLEIPETVKIAVFIGVLSVHKGVSYLLRGTARLLDKRNDLHLLIVGGGALEGDLRRDAASLGIQGRVHFTGRVPYSEIPVYLAASDFFVLPSIDEGMPRVILEAMSMALPVLATRVGGNPEIVAEGETGVLVPPADPEALATGMETILGGGDLLKEWGRRARDAVRERFDYERGVQGYARAVKRAYQINQERVP